MLTATTHAHRMLTQALADQPVDVPTLDLDSLVEATSWLRERGGAVLTSALRGHELLDAVVFILQTHAAQAATTPTPALPWQQRATVEIMGAELTGDSEALDERVATYLASDPGGMLSALAVVVAHLYRLHDGEGAPALVRALTPVQEPAGE